jgi:uncharacterized protein YlxW (UPF0749 family)
LKEKLEEAETATAKLKSELTSEQEQVNVLQASVESLQKQLDQAHKYLQLYSFEPEREL